MYIDGVPLPNARVAESDELGNDDSSARLTNPDSASLPRRHAFNDRRRMQALQAATPHIKFSPTL